jgi:hypothetical protein
MAERSLFVSKKLAIAFETIASTTETMFFVAIIISKAKKLAFQPESTLCLFFCDLLHWPKLRHPKILFFAKRCNETLDLFRQKEIEKRACTLRIHSGKHIGICLHYNVILLNLITNSCFLLNKYRPMHPLPKLRAFGCHPLPRQQNKYFKG